MCLFPIVTVGWSVVCDCGHTELLFDLIKYYKPTYGTAGMRHRTQTALECSALVFDWSVNVAFPGHARFYNTSLDF